MWTNGILFCCPGAMALADSSSRLDITETGIANNHFYYMPSTFNHSSSTTASLPSSATNISAYVLNGNQSIVLPRPVNISVILIQWYPPAVRIHWDYSRQDIRNCRLQAFQIIYHPVRSRQVMMVAGPCMHALIDTIDYGPALLIGALSTLITIGAVNMTGPHSCWLPANKLNALARCLLACKPYKFI